MRQFLSLFLLGIIISIWVGMLGLMYKAVSDKIEEAVRHEHTLN